MLTLRYTGCFAQGTFETLDGPTITAMSVVVWRKRARRQLGRQRSRYEPRMPDILHVLRGAAGAGDVSCPHMIY
jgi:hypothetical protein